MPAASTTNNDVVTLNVGGRIFQTTLSTLRAVPDSVLAAMFRKDSSFIPGTFTPTHDTNNDENSAPTNSKHKETSSGSIFLDRDPQTFDVVLRYLRTRKLLLESQSPVTLDMVEAEADFFQLSELKILCTNNTTHQKSEKDAAPQLLFANHTLIIHQASPDKSEILYAIAQRAASTIQRGEKLYTIAELYGAVVESRSSREKSMVRELINRGYAIQKVERRYHYPEPSGARWVMFQPRARLL
ncbi:BTB/POZ domain-containing protein kctd6 [Quaeritorhiza haematococci]|nr:BTB/POZ domain-containing protein kctd6 [Quaeritorhiza haematococci]